WYDKRSGICSVDVQSANPTASLLCVDSRGPHRSINLRVALRTALWKPSGPERQLRVANSSSAPVNRTSASAASKEHRPHTQHNKQRDEGNDEQLAHLHQKGQS